MGNVGAVAEPGRDRHVADRGPDARQPCQASGERALRLTLTEGKYHQVKRMIAAVGNRVEALQRSAFGSVGLDGLAPGAWRWADAETDFPILPRQE